MRKYEKKDNLHGLGCYNRPECMLTKQKWQDAYRDKAK